MRSHPLMGAAPRRLSAEEAALRYVLREAEFDEAAWREIVSSEQPLTFDSAAYLYLRNLGKSDREARLILTAVRKESRRVKRRRRRPATPSPR
jgi:hypothetical protein